MKQYELTDKIIQEIMNEVVDGTFSGPTKIKISKGSLLKILNLSRLGFFLSDKLDVLANISTKQYNIDQAAEKCAEMFVGMPSHVVNPKVNKLMMED